MECVCMYTHVNEIVMRHIINFQAFLLLLTEAAIMFEIINEQGSTGM